MSFTINNYNQLKSGKVLNYFFNLNKNRILSIKNKVIKNDFINISVFTYNLYKFFNVNHNKVNLFIKLNIELNRVN